MSASLEGRGAEITASSEPQAPPAPPPAVPAPDDPRTSAVVEALRAQVAAVGRLAAEAAGRHAEVRGGDTAGPLNVAYLAAVADRVLAPLRADLEAMGDPVAAALRAVEATATPTDALRRAVTPVVEAALARRRAVSTALERAVVRWMETAIEAVEAAAPPDRHWPESARLVFPRDTASPSDEASADGPERPPGDPASALEGALRAIAAEAVQLPPPEPQEEEPWSEGAAEGVSIDQWWKGDRRDDREHWTEVANRIETCRAMAVLRVVVQEHASRLLARAWGGAVEPVCRALAAAQRDLDDVAPAVAAILAPGAQPADAASALRRRREEIAAALERRLTEVAQEAVSANLEDLSGQASWNALLAEVARLPGELRVHAIDEDGTPGRRVEVDLREAATDALAPPWPQQLADEAAALQGRLVRTGNALDQVSEIVEYNLDSALEELTATPGDAAGAQDPLEHAGELSRDGLRRAADRLSQLRDAIGTEWRALADELDRTVADDWSALERRMEVRRQVSERIVGWQTRLARWSETLWYRLRLLARRGGDLLARGFRWSERRVRQLIRRGQTAVGVADAVADPADALAPVRETRALMDRLPRVYRRLFTLDPLPDATLATGRARELVGARRHIERWSAGEAASPLVLVGAPGSGRTTMLNLIAGTAVADLPVHRWTLAARPADADTFARWAAAQLDVPGAGDAETFVAGLQHRPRGVCLVDGAEHLVYQAFGGTALTRGVASVLDRSSGRLLWVLSLSDGAWHFVERTMADVARRMAVTRLPSFGRNDLEELILHRHDRSGMPVRFAEPERAGAVLRQRLRRAGSDERRQEILRGRFFDGLNAAAARSVGLALVLWLRACDFTSRPDELTARPVVPLDVRFLDLLPIDMQFALRAVLLHGSLTAAEMAGALRATETAAASLIQALVGMGLVERAAGAADGSRVRYTVLPLARGPVTEFLRRRHVIYH